MPSECCTYMAWYCVDRFPTPARSKSTVLVERHTSLPVGRMFYSPPPPPLGTSCAHPCTENERHMGGGWLAKETRNTASDPGHRHLLQVAGAWKSMQVHIAHYRAHLRPGFVSSLPIRRREMNHKVIYNVRGAYIQFRSIPSKTVAITRQRASS